MTFQESRSQQVPVDLNHLFEEALRAGVISGFDPARLSGWTTHQTASASESIASAFDSGAAPFRVAPMGEGVRLGRYEVRGVLGRGGMGQVTLAWDPTFGREVAVKTVREPDNASLVRRFVEEARVTGRLEHPSIVPVHELEIDSAKGGPFLAMKRIKGRTLREVLDNLRRKEEGLDPRGAPRRKGSPGAPRRETPGLRYEPRSSKRSFFPSPQQNLWVVEGSGSAPRV
jgi:hypothetical protein